MADEHGRAERGSADEGNGRPVRPAEGDASSGAEPNGDANGAGTNGNAEGGAVIAPDPTVGARPAQPVRRTRVSGLWVGLTLAAVVLVFLLIFILQNDVPTRIRFLGLEGTLPVGVAMLFAAAAGVLLVAIPGYGRILQLRKAARRRGAS